MRATFVTLLIAAALPLAAQTPLIEQGKALMDKRDYEHAAEVLEKAVAAAPKNAEAHYLLGSVYGQLAMKAGMFGAASYASKTQTQFEEAVKADPNYLDGRVALMEYYMMAPAFMGGSESKAIEQANEIKKRDVYRGHTSWAYIYNRQKKPELARKEVVDLVREQPASPKAHLALGVQYIVEKNYPAAATEVDRALKLDPKYTQAWFRYGQLAALTGTNLPRGEESLRKYLATTPARNELPLYRAHYWLGQIYEKTGRKAEAKASYAASLKIQPEQKDVTEALKRVS